jgi:hypothetical protein
LLALLYVAFYLLGRMSMQAAIKRAGRAFATPMRKYFYVVPDILQQSTLHEFHCWVTGRKGYLGALVKAKFTMRSEPLGWLFDTIIGRGNRLVFEFVCEPEPEQIGVFSLRYNDLDYIKELKLPRENIPQMRLNLFTDFGDSKQDFLDEALAFNRKRPGVIWAIDLANTNGFDTKEGGRIVARFEFLFPHKFERFIDDELIDFVVGVADKYVSLRLPVDTLEDNVQRRAEMLTGRKFERR